MQLFSKVSCKNSTGKSESNGKVGENDTFSILGFGVAVEVWNVGGGV